MKPKDQQEFVAWHGSTHEFQKFNFAKLRDNLGIFFAEKQENAERYGTPKRYRLTFRNLLRVRQGHKYAETVAMRSDERCGRDVRRRLIKAGYDGIRIEYAGGVVDYVAFSNRGITPLNELN